ncbi:MAG: 3-oxoacyl-[acyl-carrier-protein] synthase, KASIII (EC [uncultured Campylobacterales bacterium]|uniref:Beta-ketoacyl-[acyl-carrier-protein] synthase III n=1 Tax=uncultured Campylobacterales bacterium TaxID=352960 RepID=A0A6S6SF19_9BACT|nr:MAG: 3-oxoacyl-[acyl-carrier-protein] synthase, KASIII (EC [uncultured Campylobacterales bacterium]
MYASFKSIGAYVPKKTLTNSDLEKIVDTTDEWITKRTGIKNRHIADDNEFTSDMALEASKIAIERAGINKNDIDGIIVATITPDNFCMPSTACVLADKLGIYNVMAFDVSAACSGFVYILNIAKSLIESGANKNILIVGAEKLSSIIDYEDRSTCVIFGDGAGAAIIGTTEDKSKSILDVHISSDGRYGDLLITPGGGSARPCSVDMLKSRAQYLKMSGNETFKIAVKTLSEDVINILAKNKLNANAVDHFIPHQANLRIIEAVRSKLNFPKEKTVLTIEKYGNTSAASIPMALNDAYEKGNIKKGELMLFDTFGGGFTWGSALVYFG